MSNIAMGTIFVNGFAQRQVHTDHSTSYVPKKEIIQETQSYFLTVLNLHKCFYTEYGRSSKNVTIKVKRKVLTKTIGGYDFMTILFLFYRERL